MFSEVQLVRGLQLHITDNTYTSAIMYKQLCDLFCNMGLVMPHVDDG